MLSSYARQFLGQMDKPDVDYIEGLSPAISIDQKTTSKNPRSTVGTVTEVYDYLILFVVGTAVPVAPNSPASQQTMRMARGGLGSVLAARGGGWKGNTKVFKKMKVVCQIQYGHVMICEDNTRKNKKHTLEVVVDRLVVREGIEKRLADSMETCLKMSKGILTVDVLGDREMVFSQNYACIECGFSMEELSPRFFSFNSPYGACPNCNGLGEFMRVDPALVIPDPGKSLREGAIAAISGSEDSWYYNMALAVLEHFGYSKDTPSGKWTKNAGYYTVRFEARGLGSGTPASRRKGLQYPHRGCREQSPQEVQRDPIGLYKKLYRGVHEHGNLPYMPRHPA